jgi:hypothetical protein
MCGIWVADHTVISPVAAIGAQTTARGSIALGISRCWTYRRWMTAPPAASALAFAAA